MSTRPKVLLLAEAANPEWASVPLVGWSHSQALAKVADVHLVTQIRNQRQIEAEGLVEGRDFTAIDSEAVASRLHKISALLSSVGMGLTTGTALSSLAYYYFEHIVWKRFGGAISRGEYDVVHRLTPLTPTAPSLIAKKCRRADTPFILGPLNGGLPWPSEFSSTRRREGDWLSYVRSLYTILPGYRSTLQNASAIITGSLATRAQIPARYSSKLVYIVENAIDPIRFPEETKRPTNPGPLRFAFVGRLVPYKGADMLIEAIGEFIRAGRAHLDIYGDGPEMTRLRKMVDSAEVVDGVTFHGWVQHKVLHGELRKADVFAFPSVREFGGGVVLEAMRLGLVPIVINYGGPGELITEKTGYAVELGSRQKIIQNLREIIAEIISNPSALDSKRELGMQRVRDHFTWDAKARKTLEVYRWVLGKRLGNPEEDANFLTCAHE